MRYSIKTEGEVVVAALGDKSPGAKSVGESLSDISRKVPRTARLLLDLGEVEHLDAAAVGVVLQWLAKRRTETDRIALCAHHPPLLALLELVRAHHLVEIFDNPADGARSLLCQSVSVVADKVLRVAAS